MFRKHLPAAGERVHYTQITCDRPGPSHLYHCDLSEIEKVWDLDFVTDFNPDAEPDFDTDFDTDKTICMRWP